MIKTYNILGDIMDEFKEFLKTVPSVKQDVLTGRYTWQQLYEIFVMYGKDDKFWQPYKTYSSIDLNGLLEIIKNIDLNALSSSLSSIEKVLNVASTFLDKKEPERERKSYKSFPRHSHAEKNYSFLKQGRPLTMDGLVPSFMSRPFSSLLSLPPMTSTL